MKKLYLRHRLLTLTEVSYCFSSLYLSHSYLSRRQRGSIPPRAAWRPSPAWAQCPLRSWQADRPLAAHQSSLAALESLYCSSSSQSRDHRANGPQKRCRKVSSHTIYTNYTMAKKGHMGHISVSIHTTYTD